MEALWVMVMFWTYFVWDLWTKLDAPGDAIRQRGWASFVCALLSTGAFLALADLRGTESVVLADLSLLVLVLLFRAMKLHTFSKHTRSSWLGILTLWSLGLALTILARRV